tara:strand:- start:300 stop:689 length:390 start_codon:yes stop_codon:yes gene_type:complete
MSTSTEIGEIAMILLSFRDQLKIYHWQTHSYARHKAADKLVETMTEQMDRFLETLQGSRNLRMVVPKKRLYITFENQTDTTIDVLLNEFKQWLNTNLPDKLKPMDNDLRNIRDEILGSVNQSLYLFTLK